MSFEDLQWWGYMHSNGRAQLKRWFGDHKDYTEDCKDNPFVKKVVPPFPAISHGAAMRHLIEELNK